MVATRMKGGLETLIGYRDSVDPPSVIRHPGDLAGDAGDPTMW
jgi:hypothetical protein